MIVFSCYYPGCTDTAVMPALRPKQVIQAAKMVCALLGKVETIEVTETCDLLISQCVQFDQVTAHISRDAKSLIQMSLTLKSFNQTFLN